MTDHRSPQEIEREIERERAGLTHTLDDLQERFSVDGMIRQVGDQLRDHGGEIGAAVSRSVRDNPMAVVLTGVGLAWMIFGNRDGAARRPVGRDWNDDRHVDRSESRTHDRRSEDRDRGRYASGASASRYYDTRPGGTRGLAGEPEAPNWFRPSDDPYGSRSSRNEGRGIAAQTRETLGKAGSQVSDAAAGLAEHGRSLGASVSAGAAAAGDSVSDAAHRASERAADLRARLAEGTEALSEEARSKVIAARERAIEARDVAIDYGRAGRDKAVDLFEEQPLIVGALALAVGAAVGAALPRTRTEDAYMGEHRDHLIEEAERIYAEEKAKVVEVARAVSDEVKDIAGEAKTAADRAKSDADRDADADTAAQDVADKVKDAGQRIADAARTEAEKQNLGNSRA